MKTFYFENELFTANELTCSQALTFQESASSTLLVDAEGTKFTVHYLQSELCPMGDLFDHVQAHKFSLDFTRHCAREVLQTLAEMHRDGFCHLDVKLENILVDSCGKLRLADFGFAEQTCAERLI